MPFVVLRWTCQVRQQTDLIELDKKLKVSAATAARYSPRRTWRACPLHRARREANERKPSAVPLPLPLPLPLAACCVC